MDHGCRTEQIETKLITGSKTVKAILKEADSQKYAAVVVGRRRDKVGFVEKIMKGSVTKALFQDLTGSALWICS